MPLRAKRWIIARSIASISVNAFVLWNVARTNELIPWINTKDKYTHTHTLTHSHTRRERVNVLSIVSNSIGSNKNTCNLGAIQFYFSLSIRHPYKSDFPFCVLHAKWLIMILVTIYKHFRLHAKCPMEQSKIDFYIWFIAQCALLSLLGCFVSFFFISNEIRRSITKKAHSRCWGIDWYRGWMKVSRRVLLMFGLIALGTQFPEISFKQRSILL